MIDNHLWFALNCFVFCDHSFAHIHHFNIVIIVSIASVNVILLFFFHWIPSDSEVFQFIKSFRNAKKSNKQSHKIHNQINTHTHQIQFELRASELFVHIINRYVIAIYAWLFVRFRSLSLYLSLSRSHLHQNKCWSSASFSIIASMSAAKVIPK